jgi:hypothetical protein
MFISLKIDDDEDDDVADAVDDVDDGALLDVEEQSEDGV